MSLRIGLTAWESEEGADAPTLGQLRLLAAKYHFPVAVFYLPEPPKDFAPLRDRRRLTGVEKEPISANLALQIRNAYERRELALELFADLRSSPKPISLTANVRDNPEQVGAAIRRFLRVDNNDQKRSARQARAFDYWRQRIEDDDVLVFVVSGPHHSVELNEMRGFAIAMRELPVIVVNGKDYSQGGKAFTLIHELCHVLLGESAISNGAGDDPKTQAVDRTLERFCDAVAAATLMPRDLLQSIEGAGGSDVREWTDAELRSIGDAIGVSRQALLLRFVTLRRATWDYYNARREAFEHEYRREAERRAQDKKPIPIKRHVMLMSWNGRGFTRLVLRNYYDQRITLNDVASYLGAKLKHIPALERSAFQLAE
jgi:Zn-dependent peptidase ImmA (M78 family)